MSTQAHAPVALFAYRRREHLERTLDALEACPEFAKTPIFVFSDGPKTAAAEDDVNEVRALLRERARANMTIIEAGENQGLAASIIAGVSRLCNDYGRVIVLEDDLVVSPLALRWLNTGLDTYADDPSVLQISGYQWRNPAFKSRTDAVVGRLAVSWGWATWKRAWDHFDPLAEGWEAVRTDRDMRRAFDMNNSYPFSEMLELQMTGKIDSWAIRWAWSVFREKGLVIYPPCSLVQNIGFDEKATHNSIGRLKKLLAPRPPEPWRGADIPTLPHRPVLNATDEAVFHKGLAATGAMRNRRIRAALHAVGLWRTR